MDKHFYFKQVNLTQVICLHSVKMSNNSIWPIDRTLSSATTPGQSGPGSNGNEGVHHIPKNSRTGALPSDLFRVVFRTFIGDGGLTPLQRRSQCVLQSQLTMLPYVSFWINTFGKGMNSFNEPLNKETKQAPIG